MNKNECIVYNKLLLLSMDIENVFGNDCVIEKLYFHFNRSSVNGKYIKPYAIKFIINKDKEITEYKWSLADIYENMNIIPLYIIKSIPKTNYGIVDINDKVYPVANTELLSRILPLEDISYEFEVKHGSIIIDDVIISKLESILTENNIEYDVHYSSDNKTKKYMSIYGTYEECDPSYKIIASLDGRNYIDSGFCISPEPIDYKPYKSIGKFKYFSGKIVDIPNDEHLALITKCPECEANIICDWLSLKGTKCPYCDSIVTL